MTPLIKKIIVTSQRRTYTKAFPLNDVKRWQSVESLLEKVLEVLENLLEVLRKAIEKLCAELLENLWRKFTQAILGVEAKQSFIRLS